MEEQILDQSTSSVDGVAHVKVNLAGAGKRFLNYVIDAIVFYVLMFAYGILLALAGATDAYGEVSAEWLLAAYLLLPAYYIVMEASFGKTIGKFVTGTRVVTEDNRHPEFMTVVGRTFCRIIPFEPFSLLGAKAVGWHDSISRTRVILDR